MRLTFFQFSSTSPLSEKTCEPVTEKHVARRNSMAAADVPGRCLFMVVGLCFGALLTWHRQSPAAEFDSTSHSDITKQLKRMKLHDPGAIPSLGTPDGSLGGWSAMKGGNKLSAEQRATLLASSKSVGSLVKIEQVNEPSPVAKEERGLGRS